MQNMSQINSSLRKVRLIQWALIAWLLISAGLAETVCGRGNPDWTRRHWLVAGLAVWAASVGFRFRPRLLRRAKETLEKDAASFKGLKQWEVGNVIGLLMAAGVAGWGLVVVRSSWHSVASPSVLRGGHISSIAMDAPIPSETSSN
jgi:hypothetical protein